MSLSNTLYQRYKSVAEYFTPVLKNSEFLKSGKVTPEEFVDAGNVLVQTTPAWCWQSADKSKAVSYLPPDKQYLLIKNVICPKRVRTLAAECNVQAVEEEGWVDTVYFDTGGATHELGEEQAESSKAAPPPPPPPPQPPQPLTAEDEENVPDLEDFDDVDNIDVAALTTAEAAAALTSTAASSSGTALAAIRYYSISITYDRYYQTPRLWMYGSDENGKNLTKEQIFEDIDADYSNKTVTLESHPFTTFPQVSIHPCRHAEMMKREIERINEVNQQKHQQQTASSTTTTTTTTSTFMRPDLYLFVFLKYMHVVIPTMEYDLAYIDI